MMGKPGEQPPPQQQQEEPKRGAEEMSLDAPMPPIFGNANQSEGDVFKVCPCVSLVCIPMQHGGRMFRDPRSFFMFVENSKLPSSRQKSRAGVCFESWV